MEYFKKLVPQNPVTLSGNRAIRFESLEGVIGYCAQTDAGIVAEFREHIRKQQFGLSEISCDEFVAEFLQKKRNGIQPFSGREELSPSTLSSLASRAAQHRVAAGVAAVSAPLNPATAPTVVADPATPPGQAPLKPEFNPPTGIRKGGRKARSLPPSAMPPA